MNKFTSDAPVMVVISEEKYVKTAAFGSKVTGNDYRSVDIGIAAAYFTAAAEEQGLSTCILGWLNRLFIISEEGFVYFEKLLTHKVDLLETADG